MMHAAALTAYLHRHIPLSQAMQANVSGMTADSLTLAAPFAPNINHQSTVFGGSASTLAILAAWSFLHLRLHEAQMSVELVIQRNEMDYRSPMTQDFRACAQLAPGADWQMFIATLQRRGRARIAVTAALEAGAGIAGQFRGEFVALRART